MLCEKCKEREANVIVTEIVNGVKTQHNFCSQCASKMDLGPFFEGDFPFTKLLSGILDLGGKKEAKEGRKLEQFSCPTCHTTYGQLIRNGKFGCSDCYSTFGLLIENRIKKIQGKNVHIGKKPKYNFKSKNKETALEIEESKEDKILLLQSRLQEAIAEENYEMAAKYRDEILQLKKEIKNDE